MQNPATQPRDELNPFTKYVMMNPGTRVVLRNGTVISPEYKQAVDETEEDFFFAWNYEYCWDLDGHSVTSRDYDMMELSE